MIRFGLSLSLVRYLTISRFFSDQGTGGVAVAPGLSWRREGRGATKRDENGETAESNGNGEVTESGIEGVARKIVESGDSDRKGGDDGEATENSGCGQRAGKVADSKIEDGAGGKVAKSGTKDEEDKDGEMARAERRGSSRNCE